MAAAVEMRLDAANGKAGRAGRLPKKGAPGSASLLCLMKFRRKPSCYPNGERGTEAVRRQPHVLVSSCGLVKLILD